MSTRLAKTTAGGVGVSGCEECADVEFEREMKNTSSYIARFQV